MLKTEGIALLGGSVTSAATAIGINPQAVTQWPDVLPDRLRDRVQAALYRRSSLRPVNWKQTIADIQRLGKLTQPQISERCDCGQATVSDLANGVTAQPRHALGEALLALLAEVTPTTET